MVSQQQHGTVITTITQQAREGGCQQAVRPVWGEGVQQAAGSWGGVSQQEHNGLTITINGRL